MATLDPNLELARLKIELHNDEKPFEIIPKHWGGMMWSFVGLGAFLVGSIIAFALIFIFSGTLTQLTYIFVALIGLGYIVAVIFGLSEWYSLSQRVIVITNERIIDCQQINFVSRHLQVIDIHAIKTATGKNEPGWGTVFNFGSLTIDEIGNDKPTVIKNIPSPSVIAGQVLHYHNLVAHGGAESAHNTQANSINEDKTPTLEELPKVADQIAEDPNQQSPVMPGQPSPEDMPQVVKEAMEKAQGSPPPQPEKPPADKQSLLLFNVPNEKLQDTLNDLPAKKSPSVTPLENRTYSEVRTIVPADQAQQIADQLKAKGAEDIAQTELEPLA